jgi:hypothetical protein
MRVSIYLAVALLAAACAHESRTSAPPRPPTVTTASASEGKYDGSGAPNGRENGALRFNARASEARHG